VSHSAGTGFERINAAYGRSPCSVRGDDVVTRDAARDGMGPAQQEITQS